MKLLKSLYALIKIGIALTALIGLGMELSLTLGRHDSIINFFSYFTTIGNIFVPVVLAISGFYLLAGKPSSRILDFLRGMALVTIILIGVVYAVLLAGNQASEIPWVNIFHHYIMPIALVIDWLIQPPASKLSIKSSLLWLTLPVVYLAYALIRGAVTDFYPYEFLNPVEMNGYTGVFLYCGVMIVAYVILGALAVIIGNLLRRKQAQ